MESIVKEVSSEPVEEKIEVHTDTPSSSVKEYVKIADYFGIDDRKMSQKEEGWLSEIYNWCKSDTESEIFNKLVTKRCELGTPRLGESRLFQMYTWLRLSKDYELAKENLTKYEVGGA